MIDNDLEEQGFLIHAIHLAWQKAKGRRARRVAGYKRAQEAAMTMAEMLLSNYEMIAGPVRTAEEREKFRIFATEWLMRKAERERLEDDTAGFSNEFKHIIGA
jgi:hypothetical protein